MGNYAQDAPTAASFRHLLAHRRRSTAETHQTRNRRDGEVRGKEEDVRSLALFDMRISIIGRCVLLLAIYACVCAPSQGYAQKLVFHDVFSGGVCADGF